MQPHSITKFSIKPYLFENNDHRTWAGSFKHIPLHSTSLLRHFVCDVLSLTIQLLPLRQKKKNTVITHKCSHKIPLTQLHTDSLYCLLECSFRLRPWDEVLDPNATVLGVAAHSTVDEDSSPDLYQPQVFIGFKNF